MTTLKRNDVVSELTTDAMKPQNQVQDLSLKFEEIKSLISLISREHIDELQLETSNIKLHIRKTANNQITSTVSQITAHNASSVLPLSQLALDLSTSDQLNDSDIHYITSPIVGTFYRASNANASAFVKPGDSVKPGQTLCIVEAMKLMNEIECDVSGELIAVMVDDGHPVEYGERLFSIRVY